MTKDSTEADADERTEPTPRATRECAEWLTTCLRLGWPKLMLDDLEQLWWKYHDNYGRPTQGTAVH
jgi:hypothetical protein